ncbi:hypothetical protein JCM8097_000660 [Rhodosporidiobolus ruineniae]
MDSEPVASTSQLPPRIPASLSTLPPELKILIVQKVAEADLADVEGDDDEAAWSDDDDDPDGGLVMDHDGRPLTATAEQVAERIKKARTTWETLSKLPRGDDGNPTDEALEKVRERLLELAKPSGIEALTLLNREFSEYAMPWMWRELDFEGVSNEAILDLIHDVLPRRARHVQSLAFGQVEAHMLRDDTPGTTGAYEFIDPHLPLSPRRAAIVEAAEHFPRRGPLKTVSTDGKPLSSEVRSRRTKSLLVAEVVRQCANIIRVDCESFPKVPPGWVDDLTEEDFQNSNVVYPHDHALEELALSRGAGLTDLTLLVNDDGVTNEADIASYLDLCPSLLRLELELLIPSHAGPARDRLHRVFEQRLTKLESLNIVEGQFVNDAFAELDLRMPLKVLALGMECEDLTFTSFYTLVHRFADTLECLDLRNTPNTNSEEDTKNYVDKPVRLPKLDTLVIETQHESPFLLEAFRPCPIRVLSFGFCPTITYPDLERFLDIHQETLRRIEVHHDAALTAGQVESLEVLCHARGVECELLDAADTSSDEDDLSEIDEDEEDFGGWTDEEDDEDEDEGWSDEDQ